MSSGASDPPAGKPTLSVVIPTYRRPESLGRCLQGFAGQTVPPDEVIVVRRAEDRRADSVAAAAAVAVRVAVVARPGVVSAMAAGSAAARGEVVAFCDDDAVPRPDWAARLRAAFADPRLGAFGGRDVLGRPHPIYPPSPTAGTLGPWGRLTGDHHRVVGPVRDTDVLKAVNMAFRSTALRFPCGLRGAGAQVHFEVAMCLAARDAGWSVRLDPDLLVDHLPEARFDADRRGRPAARAVSDAAFNYTYALLSARPELWGRRAAFGILVGDAGSPGLARAGLALLRRDWETVRRLGPSLHGQAAALIKLRRGDRLALVAPDG